MSTSISSTGISTPSVAASQYNGGQLAGFRNKIINGDFSIWRRGTSSSTAGGTFTADRWRQSGSTTGTLSVARTRTVLDLPGFKSSPYCLQWVSSGATSSMALEQFIEGVDTLSNGRVRVSFYIRLNSGNLTGATVSLIQRFGTGGSPAVTLTQPLSISQSPQFTRVGFDFDLPSVSDKTLGVYNNLTFALTLPTGSFGFEITGVQVERGDVTTDFENRPESVERDLCERYFNLIRYSRRFYNSNSGGIYDGTTISFPTMRTTPTVVRLTLYDALNTSGITHFGIRDNCMQITVTPSGNGDIRYDALHSLDAEIPLV